jgi:cell division protein FtsW
MHADELDIGALDDAVIERRAAGWGRSVMIIATAVGLMAIGSVMAFSATVRVDGAAANSIWEPAVLRQFVFTLSGLVSMLIIARIPYRIWTAFGGLAAVAVFAFSIGLACLVFVPHIGVRLNEAVRWIRLPGGLTFQPSEAIKITLPILLAVWMTRNANAGPARVADAFRARSIDTNVRQFFTGLMPALMAIGLAVGVVGIEDFGTAALLAAVGGAMLLIGGARIWHLMLLMLPVPPAFAFLLFSRAHRMSRITSFMDIWADPEGKNYQAVQSLCTIVSGGWAGRGLGRGFVKGYLPMASSDFIFAVICEELGIIGAIAVIALLIAFLWQCRLIVRDCADPTGRLLAFGVVMTFGVQAVMNIAVVTVSCPTKGISLPLVSAGGSGVLCLGALVGILASVARYGGLIEREQDG